MTLRRVTLTREMANLSGHWCLSIALPVPCEDEKGHSMALTWKEAAIEALRGSGPLSAADIVRVITERGLRSVTGATPEATVGAVLYTAVQDGDPRVRLVGSGAFEHTGSAAAPQPVANLAWLEPVDIRDVWENEARDFTPWLLANADRLGEMLGIDIELEAREYPVGEFSLDLFGRDITNECPLIVENQLAETNHTHLGQLLTYAAGTQAATVVWVAPSFRDEHRKALDYLNDKAGDDARFFGVEVRVVRIGDSPPAPMFSLAAKPSEWRARVEATQESGELSEKREAYRAFWGKYLEAIHERHPGLTNVKAASTRNWTNINYLRRGVNISLAFLAKGRMICEIYIDTRDAERNSAILGALVKHKAEVERAVGEQLQWDDIPLKRACRIRAITDGDVLDTKSHDKLITWLADHQFKMKQVIKPLVEALPDSLWTGDEHDDE
jgi:hypothetical protein